MSKLAIDFDGVIHDYKHPIEGRRMGGPMEDAKESIIALKQRGHEIIVFSVWGGEPKVIADWMKFYEIPYDTITHIKPNADYFIDDRALHFESWKNTLHFLNSQTSFLNS